MRCLRPAWLSFCWTVSKGSPPSTVSFAGGPPRFFDGNPQAFTGLHFHLDDESFEFYSPLKMKDDPLWINVTELMQQGVGPAITRLMTRPKIVPELNRYVNRLSAIYAVNEIDLHIEEVSGEDKTVDVVVDIFNRVNSGGTKLSRETWPGRSAPVARREERDEETARKVAPGRISVQA